MKKPEQLGDAPIEEAYEKKMNHIAVALDRFFNGDLRGQARPTGFVLMVFPFGDDPVGARCNYISNGALPGSKANRS